MYAHANAGLIGAKTVPKLTDTLIRNAALPAAGTRTIWDESPKGFGVRISQGGTKTFIVLIASGRRQKIGRYPLMSLATARAEAKRILAEKTLGRVRPAYVAHDEAIAAFLRECARKNKPKTLMDYRRLLERHFAFGRKSVGDVRPRDIVRRLDALSRVPGERRYAFAVGRAFYRWCVAQHLIERSPMEGMRPPAVGCPRDRVLSDEELARVYRTALTAKTLFHTIVAFLVLTGQRRNEIASLRWDYLDEDNKLITLPPEVTKNGRTHTFPYHTLPLPPRCSEYLFPARTGTGHYNGWSRSKRAFDQECGVHGWTLHDLRRTFSSGMAALGVQQVVVEKLLNHVSGGVQSPIAQVYNRHRYLNEMGDAILRWENHLSSLIVPKG